MWYFFKKCTMASLVWINDFQLCYYKNNVQLVWESYTFEKLLGITNFHYSLACSLSYLMFKWVKPSDYVSDTPESNALHYILTHEHNFFLLQPHCLLGLFFFFLCLSLHCVLFSICCFLLFLSPKFNSH